MQVPKRLTDTLRALGHDLAVIYDVPDGMVKIDGMWLDLDNPDDAERFRRAVARGRA